LNTGLLKPDPKGNDRAFHKGGGHDHSSFEVDRCDPEKSIMHIAARFSAGSFGEEFFMDLLDDQLLLEELVVFEHVCAAEGSESVCRSKGNKENTRTVAIAAH
jgi:hypothetical protein